MTDESRIDSVVRLIERLMLNNLAYVSNGSIYLDERGFTESNPVHGLILMKQLAIDLKDPNSEEAIVDDPKRSPGDIIIWESIPTGERESYLSPWGRGQPKILSSPFETSRSLINHD